MAGNSQIRAAYFSAGVISHGVSLPQYSSSSSSAGRRQGTAKQFDNKRGYGASSSSHNKKQQHKALVGGSKESVTYKSSMKVEDKHRGLTAEYSTQVKHKKVIFPTPNKKITTSPTPNKKITTSPTPTKMIKTTYYKY